MKRIFVVLIMTTITSASSYAQYVGRTDRGGAWVEKGSSLVFVGDRLDGTIFNPKTMTGSVVLDGKRVSGCKFSKSRSNPKGIRIGPCAQKTSSGLDEADGLGVRTQ